MEKKTNKRLFLDIHAIQTLPPSNINRDDTGSPKTAIYGGVRRARVSSQSWKRAMREYFSERVAIGKRSKYIPKYLKDKLMELNINLDNEDVKSLTNIICNELNLKVSKEGKLNVLFFLSDAQIQHLAEEALNEITEYANKKGETIDIIIKKIIDENKKKDKKKEKEANKDEIFKFNKDKLNNTLIENSTIDIALFGRMLADDPSLNEDASSQVAHAISTHAVQNEFDFYTAIDDEDDNAGAGMLGSIEFNSSTLYRYSNVAVHEFFNQLKDDKEALMESLKLFIEAFSNSLPTGKINSFANQTLPQALFVILRDDRPISLVTAFEKPIKPFEGYVEKSIEKLVEEFENIEKFVNKPLATMYVIRNCEIDNFKEVGEKKESLTNLLDDFWQKLSELIDEYKGE